MILSLILSDIIASLISFIAAYFLRNVSFFRFFLDSIQPITVYLRALPFAVTLLLVIFYFYHLYETKHRVTRFSEMYSVVRATTFWTLLIMAGSYITKFDYSRVTVILFYFLTMFFVIIGRIIVRDLQVRFINQGFGRTNILIVGNSKPAREIAKRLDGYKNAGIYIVGFIAENNNHNEKVIGKLSDLYKILKQHSIDEVYIADSALSYEKILTIIADCPYPETTFKIASNIFKLVTGNVDIANLESIPSINLSKTAFPLWKKLYKRSFDIVFATISIVLTFPLWIVIILFIKHDSEGKAILKQKRIGLYGKPFLMYKFRTMKENKKNASEEVTHLGKFLRSTSLDELPQLVNILRGEMSIIGPRPELPQIVKRYKKWQKRRTMVKPGLTGLWQILGRKDLPLSENLEYDFYYINNQSFLLDLVIILKTIPLVIIRRGAY